MFFQEQQPEDRPTPDGGLRDGVNIAYSPDGLSWNLHEGDHILDYHSNFANHLVRDPDRGQWLLYCRPIHMFGSGRKPLRLQKGFRHMRRRLSVMVSRDLQSWSYPRTCFYPDELDNPDFDTVLVFRYGGQFLAFYGAMEGEGLDFTEETRFASSRDGVHWEPFHSRQPYMPLAREGDWDAGQAVINCPPVRQGEDMLIYYWGSHRPQSYPDHRGAIGVAVAKVDRFVEQRAGDRPGYLLTREFILEGNRLKLNTVMPGMPYHDQLMRVEIARHPPLGGHYGSSQPYPGFSFEDSDVLKGTRTDMVATWNGSPDLSELAGKPVYLRFEIVNMGLFSFKVTQE